jgi:hypothetical protein
MTIMAEAAPNNSPVRVFEVGPDRVTVTANEAVIEAKNEMPDWEVREENYVPVYLEDKKYLLVQKRRGQPPYGVRYLLHPWPQYQATNAKTFLTYDAEAVTEREARLRTGQLDELGRAFLMPLYPLLGLLWSGMQKRLHRFGFVSHAITGFSVFTVFSLLFAQGVFAVIMLNMSLRSGKLMLGGFLRALISSDRISVGPLSVSVTLLDIIILLALIIDCIVRYSLYLRDDQWSGGFFEWIIPHRKHKSCPKAIQA